MQKNIIEKRTGDLYSECFSRLNSVDENWFNQAKLLSQQLGLSEEKVKDKICFDGGCGPGTLTYQMAKWGAKKVIGVDLKPTLRKEMFENMDNVYFIQASLLSIPINSGTFDLVASTGVLQHTANPEKALSEMARILKQGGYLHLGVYGKYGLFSWCLSLVRIFTVKIPVFPKRLAEKILVFLKINPLLRYQIIDYGYVPCLYRFSPNQLKKLFAKYGLENPKRIFNVSAKEAKNFRKNKTVYTYDPRTLSSRILFGYGFINITARKNKS